MAKTCAFLGNDYDITINRRRTRCPNLSLVEKVKERVVRLIQEEDVDTFLVGEIGGFEQDAYDAVLAVKKIFPDIKIILVISKTTELHKTEKYFNDFILPDNCVTGYKKLSIIYRNRFLIENTDFIIAYNQYHGRAYEFCRQAQKEGIMVIELA